MAFEDLKYAQRNRLEYLDRLFFWNGAATRASLIQQFGISNAQAALDFRAYLKELGDDALIYDATSRQYLAQKGFQRLTGPAATSELLEFFESETRSIYDEFPDLQRSQNVHAFLPLYRAIRAGQSVEIVYQSMRDPEPETRMIAPRALSLMVSDCTFAPIASRANNSATSSPSRIDLELSFLKSSVAEDVPRDDEWFTWSVLELRPHKRLAASQQRVVRTEFGFTEDVLEIRIRQALEFYTTRRWGTRSRVSST